MLIECCKLHFLLSILILGNCLINFRKLIKADEMMKGVITIFKKSICIILLLAITLLCGCTDKKNSTTIPDNLKHESTNVPDNSTQPVESSENQVPAFMEEIKNLSDEELLYKYVNGLEIALELIFEDPDEIPSDTLFMFFLYSLDTDNYYEEYEKLWYNEKDNKFHIPIKDIETQLDRYFEHYSLDPTKIYGYSASENAVVINTITGFGGDVFTKVKDKKFDYDKLTLVVDFYDSSFQNIIETKEYVFRFYETGYYLLSVTKK